MSPRSADLEHNDIDVRGCGKTVGPPMRSQKVIHAALSIVIFAIAGPWIGLVLLMLHGPSIGALNFWFMILNPISLFVAYAIAGKAAIAAGSTYCLVSLALTCSSRTPDVDGPVGALLGLLSAAFAVFLVFVGVIDVGENRSVKADEFMNLGLPAGLLCGFLAGRFCPVRNVGECSDCSIN